MPLEGSTLTLMVAQRPARTFTMPLLTGFAFLGGLASSAGSPSFFSAGSPSFFLAAASLLSSDAFGASSTGFSTTGSAFTSTATQHGGQETTLFSIITNLLHHGLAIVGLDYGYSAQMGVDEVKGGSPYGATTIADGDGSRLPSEADLNGARYQGKRIAETAAKLFG